MQSVAPKDLVSCSDQTWVMQYRPKDGFKFRTKDLGG